MTFPEDTDLKETLYALATLVAAYSNPHLFPDLRDIPEEIIDKELEALKNIMGEMIG